MPYVSPQDRTVLDSHIFKLIDEMNKVITESDLPSLSSHIDAVAAEIKNLDAKYGYYGAFAGELNYSMHTIFLCLLPDIRYWIMALSTGWLKRVALLFRTNFAGVVAEHEKSRDHIPFGTSRVFKHLTEWVLVRLAAAVAPDQSKDASDLISGVFEHMDSEFYRRVGFAYEDKQIVKSGDVPKYKEWLDYIAKK